MPDPSAHPHHTTPATPATSATSATQDPDRTGPGAATGAARALPGDRRWWAVGTGLVGSVLLALAGYGAGARPHHSPIGVLPTWSAVTGDPAYGLAVLAWLAATALLVTGWWLLRHAGGGGGPSVRLVLVATASWAVPLLLAPPLGSRDLYAYAAQGDLYAHGFDPYRVGPAAYPSPWLPEMSPAWLHAVVPYGPLALLVMRLAAWASGGNLLVALTLLRLAAVLGLLLTAAYLPRLARACGVPPGAATWLGLASPLLLVHLVSGAHNDALMIGFLVTGLTLATRATPHRIPDDLPAPGASSADRPPDESSGEASPHHSPGEARAHRSLGAGGGEGSAHHSPGDDGGEASTHRFPDEGDGEGSAHRSLGEGGGEGGACRSVGEGAGGDGGGWGWVWRRAVPAGVALALAAAVKATALVVVPFAVVLVVPAVGGRWRFWKAAAAVVGAVVAAFGLVTGVSGLGFGWVGALAGTADSVQWTSVPTGVGMAISAVLGALGLPGGGAVHAICTDLALYLVLPVVLVALWWPVRHGPRAGTAPTGAAADGGAGTGLGVAGAGAGVSVAGVSVGGVVRRAGWGLVALVACSPAVHPWYVLWGVAVLAGGSSGGRVVRWVAVVVSGLAFLALPDGYNLARETVWLGAPLDVAVVVALAVALAVVGVRNYRRWELARRPR